MTAILVMTYVWLQGMFDDGDLRKATELVRGFKGGIVEREIERRHAGHLAGPPAWSAELLSGFWGHVRVTCAVALDDGSTATYQFDTNLSAMSVHPANDNGKAVLAALTGTAGTASAAAPGSAAGPAP